MAVLTGAQKILAQWELVGMADRIETANAVLREYSIVQIERRSTGFYVLWEMLGKSYAKRWQSNGGDFFPTWQFPQGGTCCTSVSQLVRWCRKQPVFSIQTWRYWSTEGIRLLKPSTVDLLEAGGYPATENCVLCGREIGREDGVDWWSHDGKSGPCCHWTSGCKQKTISKES